MYAELKEVWSQLTAPGAPFEVKKIKIRGIMTKTYATGPANLREVWLSSGAHDNNDYLVYEDERWTYAEAHVEVASVAAWLAENGVQSGDCVGIAMRNYPEWMLSYWATVSIGATAVGMNAWWTGQEMIFGMEDSKPKVMICDQERLDRLLPLRKELSAEAKECKIIAVRPDGRLADGVTHWAELRSHDGPMPDADIDPDSDASIFYTSGTTGRPKGAQLTHRGCVNNVLSIAFANMAQTAALAKAKGPDPAAETSSDAAPPQLSSLVCTPLFHVTANNCVAHGMTIAGGKLVHMYKWDAGAALKLIADERITNLSGVPTMSRELISHPDFEKTDTSSLKALGGGGAQIQPDLVAKIDKASSARPNTGYGMTETCGIITAVSADFFTDKPASAGPAMPVFDTKCIDADGKEVPLGEVGELCVSGGQLIRGYLNRPEATAEAIQDGWLRTGDIARIDEDGFIFIVDRAKDMVLRGGENVYCAEVEASIFEHEAVMECAVFGVEDERLGEEVGAALVLNEGSELDAAALRAHCGERLAKYKVPRYLWILDEALPRNASGKFLKRQLKEDLKVEDAI